MFKLSIKRNNNTFKVVSRSHKITIASHGKRGLAGAQGPIGPEGPSLNWRGDWAGVGTIYEFNDAVQNEQELDAPAPASSYRCILSHTATALNEPGNGADWTTYWQYIAQRGADGAEGPGVPNGGTTGQILAKSSNANLDTEWIDQPISTVSWGDIQGTLADQTDIQAALNSKVDITGDTMTGKLIFSGISDDFAVDLGDSPLLSDELIIDGHPQSFNWPFVRHGVQPAAFIYLDSQFNVMRIGTQKPSTYDSIAFELPNNNEYQDVVSISKTSVNPAAALTNTIELGTSGNKWESIFIGTGNSTIQGQLTLGSLEGVLKATAGVISGSATTADIADSSNKRYVTDAQLTVLGNTSGINTGDQDLSGYLTIASAASTYLSQANAASTYLTQSNAAASYQPLDADLTTIAGLTATTNNFLISVSNAWASRTPTQALSTLGLDSDLTTFSLPASTTISAFGATVIDDADAAAVRTTISALALAGGTLTGQLMIDGSSDQIQLLVQGNGTQTSLLAVFEDSSGNDQITFGGTGAAVFNEQGNAVNFRVESDTNANMLFVDGTNNRVGIGTASPARLLHLRDNNAIALIERDTGSAAVILGAYTSSFGAITRGYTIGADTADGAFNIDDLGAAVSGAGTNRFKLLTSTGLVINEPGSDWDVRMEGDTLAYMLFLDASDATENIALLTTAQPNWQTMDRGLFIGNAATLPTGNPTSGGFLYVDAGALKYRGSSGTITTLGNA